MKLSLQWLSDYVDLSGLAPEEIAGQLTMKIALIEGFECQGAGIQDVRVGHVVKAEPHPDADRLRVCIVNTGQAELEVVCGAPNVAAGQKIAYAAVGTELPGGFKLEKRKIRGIVSNGMICSSKELQLGEDHAGILVLDEDAPLGAPLTEVLGLDDVIFEIDNKTVTHRADLWGHYGFARELAAIFERPLKALALDTELVASAGAYPIRLEDKEGCPEYLGLLVDDVDGSWESPPWIAERLAAAEMRPINLLVDLSNFVLLETGQPTHPFDRDELNGGIVVRRGRDGEILTTLDQVKRSLTPEDVVIADESDSIAIAGIMGGGDSEVGSETKRILLESAVFDAVRVRRTSSRLGLRTDALARFEKFLDPSGAERAARRYALLLKQIQPQAKIQPQFAKAGSAPVKERSLTLRRRRAEKKLGMELETDEIRSLLTGIEFAVAPGPDADTLEVKIPGFRAGRDINCEDDLIEELGRLAGFERARSTLPKLACRPPQRIPLKELEQQAALAFIRDAGYTEITNYSFATDRQIELYHGPSEAFVSLLHPVSKEASRLRRTIVPGVIEGVAKNQLHREEMRLVEVGRGYWPNDHGSEQPDEHHELVAARWHRSRSGADLVLECRSDLDAVFQRLSRKYTGRAPKAAPPVFAHPSRCIELLSEGRRVGYLAQLHPRLARSFDLEAACAITWLDLDVLVTVKSIVPKMKPLPQFPAALRDLSVVAPKQELVADISKTIRAAGKERITGVELFDVYEGTGIADGHRSLAFRLEYRAPDRTLTDEEVQQIHDRVVKRLEKKGIELRG